MTMHFNYIIKLRDGTILNSKDISWHNYSTTLKVNGKTIYASNPDVGYIKVMVNEMEKELFIPEGYQVYQSIKAESTFSSANEERKDIILGINLGLIKDGRIIEDYFFDNSQHQIVGYKY